MQGCKQEKCVIFVEMYVFQRKMSYVQHQEYKAASGLDFNTIHFQVLPLTHGSTLEGKSLSLRFPLLITLGKDGGTNWTGTFGFIRSGLSQFPIARVMESLRVLINGKTELTLNPSLCYHALKSYTKLDDPQVQQEYAMPDLFSRFAAYPTSGSYITNPLNSHGKVFNYTTRAITAGPPFFSDASGTPIQNNTPTPYMSCRYMVYMSLPFKIFEHDLHNISSIDIICKMYSNELLPFTFNSEMAYSETLNMSCSVRFYNIPSCVARWSLPGTTAMVYKLMNKRYEVIQGPSIQASAITWSYYSLSSSLFTFGKARRMFIYVQPDITAYAPINGATDSSRMIRIPATFGFINSMTMMLNNQTYFSDWDEFRLWDMSARNGFFHRFTDSQGDLFGSSASTGVGSVICLDLKKDVPVDTSYNTAKIDVTFRYSPEWSMMVKLYAVIEYDEEIDMM